MDNPYKNLFEDLVKSYNDFLTSRPATDDIQKRFDEKLRNIKRYLKTGDLSEDLAAAIYKRDGHQENVPEKSVIKGRGRPKKTILKDITQTQLQIKMEKLSTESLDSGMSSVSSAVKIKTEITDMPAPTQIPPRKKKIKTEPTAVKRSTRTRNMKDSIDEQSDGNGDKRDSDVQLQNTTIPMIDISDEDLDPSESRSTRNKTLKETANKTDEVNEESSRSTRTKTLRKNKNDEVSKMESKESLEESTRSTRTKTIKKTTKKTEEENSENENKTNESPLKESTRSTRTKTARKAAQKNEENGGEPDTKANEEPTRTTRTKTTRKGKKNEEEIQNNNEEDFAIPEVVKISKQKKIDEGKSKKVEEETASRNTRTKTRAKVLKRDRSNDTDTEENKESEKKRSKSDEKEENITTLTDYQDAQSSLDTAQENTGVINEACDTTHTIPHSKVPALLNCTVVIDNSKKVNEVFKKKSIPSDIMTDDESDKEKISPTKTNLKTNTKEVFSPYKKTTLKKKVEAFERLNSVERSEIPRSVKKIKQFTQDDNCIVKEKTKYFTPSVSRFLPSVCSTSKLQKMTGNQNTNTTMASNESLISQKSGSGLKASQAEFRERERKRQEKEKEALKKREAMLQALTEEKRRKREEKQLKAQQQRDAMEKEKQKQLEERKVKEDAYNKMKAEREEYLQKQKEEAEKKRLQAKRKAQEQKLHEKYRENKIPIYMTTHAPLLPTDDCYDSDDDEYGKRKIIKPDWASENSLRRIQLTMITAGDRIKNTFFSRQAQSADLKEIFESIDPAKLRRNSSALWRKPPRYTLMPDLEEFSDDDDF